MVHGYDALTDKEKQTLRLLLTGHDAKSMARHFGLSVHTINERLRDARRKLCVSSSKEAARLLREAERTDPETFGDTPFGDAGTGSVDQHVLQPGRGASQKGRAAWAIGGFAMISLLAAMFAFSTPLSAPNQVPTANAAAPVSESAVTRAARDWLALVDAGKWQESWAATAPSFRALNTVQAWQSASERVRRPLGPVRTRTLVSEQDTPAPPHGYTTVRFRTDFANKGGATETLSLDRDEGVWKVVGIYVE